MSTFASIAPITELRCFHCERHGFIVYHKQMAQGCWDVRHMHNVSSSILATDDRNAACVARTIVTLYKLEKKLRHKKAPLEEMENERKAKPYPILKHLETYMQDVHRDTYTPPRGYGEGMALYPRRMDTHWQVRVSYSKKNTRTNVERQFPHSFSLRHRTSVR